MIAFITIDGGVSVDLDTIEGLELFSHQLLERADPNWFQVDGRIITITATNVTLRYEVVGKDDLAVTAQLVERVDVQ